MPASFQSSVEDLEAEITQLKDEATILRDQFKRERDTNDDLKEKLAGRKTLFIFVIYLGTEGLGRSLY